MLEVKCFFRCRATGVVPQLTECPAGFYDQVQGTLETHTTRYRPSTYGHSPPLWLQVQGQLEILGHEWCDLMLYTPARKFAPNCNYCIVRVPRNASHFEVMLYSL